MPSARLVLLALALAACAASMLRAVDEAPLALAAVGDCEKLAKDEAVPASPHFWDPKEKRVLLHGGRNEMVAAQLMLTARTDVKDVNVEIGDLKGPGVIAANPNLQLAQECYQFVEAGRWYYSIGNGWIWDKNTAFPDRKWYPEILAPFRDPYGSAHKPVGAPFDIQTAHGANQGVWIDLYIPKDAAPGVYTAPIRVTAGKELQLEATLQLTVHSFTLPDEAHVDGYGEFYGICYEFENAVYKQAGFDKWWPVAKRYHQMAHQHRFEISDREGRTAGPKFFVQRDLYDKAYGAILDGALFTPENGYVGPGANTGVTFWRAPFPEVNGRVDEKTGKMKDWTDAELQTYTEQAKAFWEHCVEKKWDKKRFFAYILDECANTPEFRANQKKLAAALDAGAGKHHIDLMWTSHTNPKTLAADAALDLRGVIRWWSPNAAACDAEFLHERMQQGETAWFYHHAPPAIGLNVVNASGIDLRTWGVACWRYKINGSFWWAMDYHDVAPKDVMTKAKENRWGNGTLFYPGARLPDLGLPAIEGPLSCLRMKAYRRGQQDYEYGWLLKQAGKEAVADAAVKKVLPVALAEAMPAIMNEAAGTDSQSADATGKAKPKVTQKIATPPWSTDVNAWYEMRAALAAELDKKP
ncbi:MAG: DUF4091 domain-containing protein [Planctomycetes bacterium]|nr:DUF4091 domain-containing protein [Planctomycetota bacterium]